MAHTYLLFNFGADEEKAQQARHKLESWKQAFRLDKKLLYHVDRGEAPVPAPIAAPAPAASEKPDKSSKGAAKSSKSEKAASKSKSKSRQGSAVAEASNVAAPSADAKVTLLVRLYFSGHEKLTEQRWLERIPAEEPFKDAAPRVIRQGDPEFDQLVDQFDSLQ